MQMPSFSFKKRQTQDASQQKYPGRPQKAMPERCTIGMCPALGRPGTFFGFKDRVADASKMMRVVRVAPRTLVVVF